LLELQDKKQEWCGFIDQEALLSLLSTGWFQERNRAWFKK